MNRASFPVTFLCSVVVLLLTVLPVFAEITCRQQDNKIPEVLSEAMKMYPRVVGEVPDVDGQWVPDKGVSVFWICSKKYHLFLGIDGRAGVLFSASNVATGRNSGQKLKEGDMRTPEGIFTVSRIQDSSYWEPYQDRATGDEVGYGPFFIRLNAGKWKGIGIHGTDPSHVSEIGTDASHGCLRLKNEDLLKVVKYCVPQQTVIILP